MIVGYKGKEEDPLFKIEKSGARLPGLKEIIRTFSAEGAEFILTQNYAHYKEKIFFI